MNNPKPEIGKKTFVILLENKWTILVFVLLSTLAGLIISLLIPNKYTASVNAVPPKTSTSTFESVLGSLSSTLKDIGLTKLTGKTEGIYSFLVILDSRAVKDSLIRKYRLDTVYNIPFTKMTKLRKTFESNLEIALEPEGNYVISFTDENPMRAAAVANDYIEISNSIGQQVIRTEASFNREYLEKRINSIDSVISVIIDSLQMYSKEKLIFSPEEQAKAISTSYIELKANKISQEVIYDLYKSRFGENDPVTLTQKNILESLKSKLSDLENKPGFVGNFPLTSLTKVGSEFLRLYAELETYTKVKSILLPLLEENRLNENKQMQFLIVLDKATPPDQKSKPKRSLIVLGAFFGSFILISCFLVFLYSFKNFLSSTKTNTEETLNEHN
jgi:tyrosine-protein kinase Etk/Wzc